MTTKKIIETIERVFETEEERKIMRYVDFKVNQFTRLKAFDYKQENAKEKLVALISPKLKDFIREAIASGISQY